MTLVLFPLLLLSLWHMAHMAGTPPGEASYLKPTLSARPGPVLAPGWNMTLWCRVSVPATRFILYKVGEAHPVQIQESSEEGAEFFFERVTPSHGGSYSCCYQTHASYHAWSQPSDFLEVWVTDMLPKPWLMAMPGPVVVEGSNVSLRCQGPLGGMSFALYRVGFPGPLWYLSSAQPWADFPLQNSMAPGTYSCYYHTPFAPYILSERSDPLIISWSDSTPQDYTIGNLIRMGLAGLVLLTLGMLLFLDWHQWRGCQDRTWIPHA
ncbi:osteoclast-associated immunoglobulin-like receptor [Trichosurus vulpecula]|uniref:osteoclast-associated immunoglobulin-like receptor n=1 Tax=Trichosurus vulpecula TaxID=9337 RepID=UPI00186ACFBB|nr:osteoclast-associated immunoglobulin-like receptor [Trichosurus vulpecula]